MADKHDRWLDRETSERLLRGESPDNAVAGSAREEAERLARTLGALSASAAAPPPADEELPGEAAALAAFRKVQADRHDLAARPGPTGAAGLFGLAGHTGQGARAGRAARAVTAVAPGGPAREGGGDAGLVRIGGRAEESGSRPRRGRPVRLGLAAALAVGMVGGVSAATAAGYLPTPFDDQGPGRPVASVSAPAPSHGRPLGSPSPTAPAGDGAASAPKPGASAADRGAAGKGDAGDDASGAPKARGGRPAGVISSCRELGAGKTLDREGRRRLEKLAGGAQRVQAYCAALLDGARAQSGSAGRDPGKGQSGRGGGGTAGQKGADGTGGRGGSDDDDDAGRADHGHGRGHGKGHGHGRGGSGSGGLGHHG
ncbi:hypothetical protein [Streptomyces sp. AK04-3B]|uniref:hypothetical protein n=1 Tax=Streptomyces sp. AK04-3B TaxID=3028650 RepID=UPI0029BE8DA2|nr:hypothetical protein [Streptomyces sp. AK04-3B]MDX3801011.1 hypothetical protein [Streptomyces sp. AK04-3B]